MADTAERAVGHIIFCDVNLFFAQKEYAEYSGEQNPSVSEFYLKALSFCLKNKLKFVLSLKSLV